MLQTPSGTEHQTSSPIFTVEGSSDHSKRPKITNYCEIEKETRLDTVGAVAVDLQGQCAASCSSGGVLIKVPGRVGQVCNNASLANVSYNLNCFLFFEWSQGFSTYWMNFAYRQELLGPAAGLKVLLQWQCLGMEKILFGLASARKLPKP